MSWTGSENQRREQGGCSAPKKPSLDRYLVPAGTKLEVRKQGLATWVYHTTSKDLDLSEYASHLREGKREWYLFIHDGWEIKVRIGRVTVRQFSPRRKGQPATSKATPTVRSDTSYLWCHKCQELTKYDSDGLSKFPKKPCQVCGTDQIVGHPQAKGNWKLLGFSTYYEYLKSDLWKAIRDKALKMARKGKCLVCRKNPPTQVHHRSYHIDVLAGKNMDGLIPCCRECHERLEFTDDGVKVPLGGANQRLREIAPWIHERLEQKKQNKRRAKRCTSRRRRR